VAALLLAACSSSGKPGADRATATTSGASSGTTDTRPASNTSSTLPYSFDDPSRGPELLNTGSDLKQIIVSLVAYADWVEAHNPSVTLVPRFAASNSTFEKATIHDFEILARLNRRLYETESGEPAVEIVDAHEADVATARYVQHLVSQTVIDKSGRVTSKRALATARTIYNILVVRGRDGHWRLADVKEQAKP